MKKILLLVTAFITLFAVSCTSVYAADDETQALFEEERQKLSDSLPEESREMIEKFGIDADNFDAAAVASVTPQKIFEIITEVIKNKIRSPFNGLMMIIAVTVLLSITNGMGNTAGGVSNETFSLISTLCLCAFMLTPLIGLINETKHVIISAGGFMTVFIPIFAGVMLAAGQTVTVGSYQLIALSAAQFVNKAAKDIIVPFLTIELSFSVASSLSANRVNLAKAGKALKKFAVWTLSITTTIFCGLLSVQGIVGTAADSTAVRTAKFLLSSSVPVVGSALGDALTSFQSGIKLVKGCIGAFGILAPIVIMAPMMIEIVLWQLCIKLGGGFCSVITSAEPLGKVLESFSDLLGLLFAITLVIILTFVITTAIMLMIGSTV